MSTSCCCDAEKTRACELGGAAAVGLASPVIEGLRLLKRKLENSAAAVNSSLGARAGAADWRRESSLESLE